MLKLRTTINCLSRLDSLIGDLLETLQDSGKANNTLVIYLGDHGADLLRGKRTSYEGGIKIPLIVYWPGETKPSHVALELVSTLDLMPTLLAVAGAEPIGNLPGLSLVPLLQGERPAWRRYLFTEYHTHSAHNFYPQRTVRGTRYKLVQNLQPGQENPGYSFTLNRFFSGLPEVIEAAPALVRDSYQRMKKPAEFELYDLQQDPYEFTDLVSNASHAAILENLKQELARWRKQTRDPLLQPANLQRLKAEIDACLINGSPDKSLLKLTYPDYFLETP